MLETNSTLDEVLGDQSGVTGVRLKSTTDSSTREITVQGCFIAIGHHPNTDIFQGQLDMKDGYLVTKSGLQGFATQTSVPGVFAAGDVRHQSVKRVASAVGEGSVAVAFVHQHLAHSHNRVKFGMPVDPGPSDRKKD